LHTHIGHGSLEDVIEPSPFADQPGTDPGDAATAVIGFDDLLAGLRAAGEGTRLRILAVLDSGELSVSELCRILGQTQPRVSRHLKLLCEAGLLVRHSEGTSAFYSPSRANPGRAVVDAVVGMIDTADPTVAADLQRLEKIRQERADAAGEYFEQIATRWSDIRSRHVDDGEVEQRMLALAAAHRIDREPIASLLDVGTGTGRILQLFADRVERGLGIDSSTGMLNVARSSLTAASYRHCEVRHGNAYALDIADGSYDLAVLHHVLHFLDDPGAAIGAAADTLVPGGMLMIVDFAPHHLETLRTDHAHRRLGFDDQEIIDWCRSADLKQIQVEHLRSTADTSNSSSDSDTNANDAENNDELLTVTVCTAIS
jgi:ArsR family transcriptional regulator